MAAYHWVYDSRHLQADCQNRDQIRNPMLGSRVWATFTFYQTAQPAINASSSYIANAHKRDILLLDIVMMAL